MSTPASTGLVRYDEMCAAIAVCERVDEAKDIRDKVRALELYYAQAGNLESERLAINVRLRAERRCGELLKEMKASGERASGGERTDLVERRDEVPTLADLGITRDQSSRFQALAEVPEGQFEATLAGPDKPSTSSVIREARAPSAVPIPDNALWLWGRLRDFERLDVLSECHEDIVDGMTQAMRADLDRLAPLVARWLLKFEGEK